MWCCNKSTNFCPGVRKKLSEKATGYRQPIGRKKRHGKKIKKLWKDPNSKYNSKERNEKLSKWMLDGHAVYMNQCMKNPSREQIDLWKICCKLLPNPILNFPFYRKDKRNYSLDIADHRLGIVIEFDGWFHFDTEEHKKYHKRRQKNIKDEGWKFLRYTIFQKFPTLEKVKKDILTVLIEKKGEEKNC